MKYLIILSLCFASIHPLLAQEENEIDEVFTIVENMPEFPGGQEGLFEYLKENTHYPDSLLESGVEGTVYIKFVVNKKGAVDNVTVVRGVDPLLDAEALRVVKSMPNWKPGTQKGKPVRVFFTLPFKFRL